MTESTQPTDEPHADVQGLRSHLKELRDQVNSLFNQRDAVSKKIRALISQIKAKKTERNLLTDEVKARKVVRSALSEEIREKIDVIKGLKEKMGPRPVQPSGPRESPSRLRARIEEINRLIETEAPSFEKEQKLMKEIKEIKRKLDESVKADAGSSEVRALSKEIDDLKVKADAAHEELQVKAKGSQSLHEQILVWSKEVDELKKEESSLQESFLAKKKEYDDLASKLGVLTEEQQGRDRSSHDRQAKEEAARQKNRISKKIQDVEDKMKRGEKLNTEDILILQGNEMDLF